MESAKKHINQFVTFYHEFRIPKNPFFSKHEVGDKCLFLSSPSRMGNHALISMLDSHPQLPKVPGEDSFLTWAFVNANHDISCLIKDVRDVDAIKKMSSDTCLSNKWFEHKELFKSGLVPAVYNGVQYDYNNDKNTSLHRIPGADSFVDFQGVVLDIDYDSYLSVLEDNRRVISQASGFNEVFTLYLKAYRSLLNDPGEKFSMDYVYACSGMRVQALWALKNNKNAKLIVSIRRFESYAISMIKSFYKTAELREEYLKEAWEQWYHKVIDYLYLKINYPNQVLLVDFDDIISDSEPVARCICRFLDIEYNESMLSATINGVNAKGNSSESREKQVSGIFYKSTSKELDAGDVPEDYYAIWSIFEDLKYDGVSKS